MRVGASGASTQGSGVQGGLAQIRGAGWSAGRDGASLQPQPRLHGGSGGHCWSGQVVR